MEKKKQLCEIKLLVSARAFSKLMVTENKKENRLSRLRKNLKLAVMAINRELNKIPDPDVSCENEWVVL